jgi:hypothetical protein
MWYDNLGVISIGEHSGGPEDGGLGDMKIDLWKLFLRHCKSTYCPAVAHYALLLLVGGDFQEFGPESSGAARRNKKDSTIELHIVIPEDVWRKRARNELRDYLAKVVRQGIEHCVFRLLSDKEVVDQTSLFRDIDEAIGKFLNIDYGDMTE